MGKRGSTRRREALRRRLAAVEDECWLCLGARGPLDLSIPTPHPLSVEMDEEIPVSKGGDPLDFRCVHLVHRACNLEKGARILPRGALAIDVETAGPAAPRSADGKRGTSRDWW